MIEKISSFIDGELDLTESEQLIRQMDEDNDLRGLWRRFNTYGSAMRDELSPALSADFSNRVLQALAKEPVQFSPAALPRRKRPWGSVAGLAVAASLVGIIILIQKPVIQEDPDTRTSNVAALSVPATVSVPAETGATQNYELIVANSKNENVRERIIRLLVEHNEYNPASDMTGIWSYSRFVGYNPRIDAH
ncbi:MAG: hypothetical protein BMS9Abin25_0857 [Gammaproteobacteria bacterium]|nr:MAG: hypothetical protein BMS9Abin25_0857 [Gammaproteobacteria bacterium]